MDPIQSSPAPTAPAQTNSATQVVLLVNQIAVLGANYAPAIIALVAAWRASENKLTADLFSLSDADVDQLVAEVLADEAGLGIQI